MDVEFQVSLQPMVGPGMNLVSGSNRDSLVSGFGAIGRHVGLRVGFLHL